MLISTAYAQGTGLLDSQALVQFLPLVPVVIPEKKAETSVRILEPSFKSARDARAGFVQRLQRQGLTPGQGLDRKQ